MPNTPNASFIPKQGPVRKVRQTASRQVHLLTVVSYVLFISTMVASGGVFLYNRHLSGQLDNEVQKLGSTIGGFSDTDMDTVREFNIRLHQAQGRLDKSVSITSIFDALEKATLQSAQIGELAITRNNDDQVLVTAKMNTDSFDASLFQRGVYERNSIIKNVEISDLTLSQGTGKDAVSGVSFVAKITIPLKDIAFKPADLNIAPKTDTQASSTNDSNLSTTTTTTTTNTKVATSSQTKSASTSKVKQ